MEKIEKKQSPNSKPDSQIADTVEKLVTHGCLSEINAKPFSFSRN